MISGRGCDFDIILISGDAYVDHPLSGVGVIARVLEARGYRIGIIERPDWRYDHDFRKLGRPRLFFGITSGAIDSMVANYTPLRRRRSADPHAPFQSGVPDRAILVYANKIRQVFPETVIIIGGIEASLRRFAHYDYWQNRIRRSILLDSRADILVYGPGELQVIEIARRLEEGLDSQNIPGTCIISSSIPPGFQQIPSFEEAAGDTEQFCLAQKAFSNRQSLAQGHANRFVLQYPMPNYRPEDLDWIYGLPYSRNIPTPCPGLAMARFSVVTHRGCLGNCSFCSLALHQGTRIISRSEESIIHEVQRLTRHPDFQGYIDDLGGPSANMYGMDCHLDCRGECLSCPRLDRSHRRLIRLLQRIRRISGLKKVFVRSGIRYDLASESPAYLKELCYHHLSGCLKIAPEHVSPRVLALMNKKGGRFEEFRRQFRELNKSCRQHLTYYFMVAHPGTTRPEALKLAQAVKNMQKEGDFRPMEGVQIFTPTPMTRSTCMYHTGRDPVTGASVFVPRTYTEKKEQKRMLFSR
ncbi:MAG: YgiQ family radical SAM protein [bacterium]